MINFILPGLALGYGFLSKNQDKVIKYGAIAIGGYMLYKAFSEKDEGEAAVTTAKDELKKKLENPTSVTQLPTYPDSQYSAMANALYTAMDGWGTDENIIWSTMMKIKNDVDWLKTFTAFGVKDYSSERWDGFFFKKDGWNLIQWLQAELDFNTIQSINSTFATKGITYRI